MSEIQRHLDRARAIVALLLATTFCMAPALAAEHRFQLLLDSDQNVTTGCSVASANGSIPGIEMVVTTTVTTTASTARVTRIEQQTCNTGTLGAASVIDAGSWPVGMGAGSNGFAVIESYVPRNLLPGRGTLRAFLASTNAQSAQDASGSFLIALAGGPGAVPVPLSTGLTAALNLALLAALFFWRRRHPAGLRNIAAFALIGLTSLTMAATIIRDGSIADWLGISPAITDAIGDAPANADIAAGYWTADANNLYVRIDADLRYDTGVNQAPQVNAGSHQTITLPATATLNGSASDDGLPNPPGALTYHWTKISGPGTVTFGNAANPATTASFSLAGSYVLQLEANDGALSGTAQLTISVNENTLSLAAIPDQTIALGARFQQVLEGRSSNPGASLSYSLIASPAGASLNPQPLLDWTPSATQLGAQLFTARVSDGQGHSASTSFTVTVTHLNQPPLLAPQADATLRLGEPFARTLQATDPDAGDTLAFSVVSGPADLQLTGQQLSWSTTGKTVGDYPVSVRVTDSGGLFSNRSFTIHLLPPVAPVALDDHYEIGLGQTLTIDSARGVLANDISGDGLAMAAARVTDPDKGSLSAFATDGSFVYQAPAAIGKVFQPVVKWTGRSGVASDTSADNLRVIDVDGDGKPEVIVERHGGPGLGTTRIAVLRGSDATVLWASGVNLPPPNQQCMINTGLGIDELVVGDLDDSGTPSILVPVQCPDGGTALGLGARFAALNARTGAVKWVSDNLGYPAFYDSHGVMIEPAFPMTFGVTPALARLRPNETPSIVFKRTVSGSNLLNMPYCDQFQASSGQQYCTGVIAIDGASGAIRQKWMAPADAGLLYYTQAGGGRDAYGHVMVADLSGSGRPHIVAGTAIWDLDGNLLSNRLFGGGVMSLALSNLDDSGQIAVLSYEVASAGSKLVARRMDGTLLWTAPIAAAAAHGHLVVADSDADGKPNILVTADAALYVYNERGEMMWTHSFTDSSSNPTIGNWSRPVVFDLDGDGVPEIIVQTSFGVEFFDGKTGQSKSSLSYAAMGYPYAGAIDAKRMSPVVVDVDGDGHAEVLLNLAEDWTGQGSWVVALQARDNDWLPARTVWNQYAMHEANITDSGHVPSVESNNFALARTNVFLTPAGVQAPVDARLREQAKFTYRAQGAGGDSNAATVTIDLRPANRPPVFTSVAPRSYLPFGYDAGHPFVYQAHAVDPDPGDVLSYALVVGYGPDAYAPNCSIGASSGRLQCSSLNGGNGNPALAQDQTLVIAATDRYGEAAFQTIVLHPSTGPVTVPNIVNLSQSDAEAALHSAGLVAGSIRGIYSLAAAQQVLTQFPLAGASVLAGEAVAMQVSLGPQPQRVPNLVGLDLNQARDQLAQRSFQAIVVAVNSATAPANEVVAQNPAFGTELAPGGAVTVQVSMGPPLSGTVAQVVVEPTAGATRLVGDTIAYRATAVYTDGTSTDVTIRSAWNTTAPAVASVDGSGEARALAAGSTTISATAGGQTGQATLTVQARTTGDTIAPTAEILAPAEGATISAPTTVTGTANDANFLRYELAYALAGETSWTVIGEGLSPVTSGALGSFDPTLLMNDLYTLRLTVFDRGGNQTVVTKTVQVSGDMKVGMFSIAFQDLSLPLAGIPLALTRTYDSRVKAKGDFGIGWRLGLNTLRLRTNRVPGTGWVRNLSGAVVSLTPTDEHKVSVSLPDGRVEEFDLQLAPTSGLGGLDATLVTGYAPRPGTVGRLQMLDNPNLLILNAGAEDELVDDTTLNAFAPARYRYIRPEGSEIEFLRDGTVASIRDPNGNTLSFGFSGITHSSGKSIAFVRDGQSRITQITDPSGKVQTYAYDANGDLVRHVDPAGNTTQFAYDRSHGLLRIVDALNRVVQRNEYDASGRVIAATNATGRRVSFAHDLDTRQELITDIDGSVTVLEYDSRGKILRSTDPLGGVSTFAYDAAGNQTSSTDPLGHTTTRSFDSRRKLTSVTNPLGHTIALSYDSGDRLASVTDPLGRTTSYTYDALGNLRTKVNALGVTEATNTYDVTGNLLTRTGATGGITQYTYDGFGNETAHVDPRGNRATATHDGNGNPLTTTDRLGSTIATVYDARNLPTKLSDPLGNTVALTFDTAGGLVSATDPSGNVSARTVDAEGRELSTVDPLGRASTRSYDTRGRLASVTDAAGNTTRFEYDALGRKIKTIFADTAIETYGYDAAGRNTTLTDASGRTTQFEYDAAGRLIRTTDALGGITLFEYDAAGNRTRQTDALGQVQDFAYDALNRLIRRTYADGSFEALAYDASGNKTSETDAAGNTTTYAYDANGNLLRVTNALGGVSTFTYDAENRLLTQTDANGHTTSFTYDALGRRASATLPGGQREAYEYYSSGSMFRTTRRNGDAIIDAFDAGQRQTARIYPSGERIDFSYHANGQIATASDSRGLTTYAYDNRNRVRQITHPDGSSVTYGYDAAGNRSSISVKTSASATARTVTATYDALQRLSSVTEASGRTTSYTYDAIGNLTQTSYPNGTVTTYAYTTRNFLREIEHRRGAVVLDRFRYTTNASGERTRVDALDGSYVTYQYDALRRLTREVQRDTGGSVVYDKAYTYDAVGNRQTHLLNGGPAVVYTYDSNDRLVSAGSVSFTYDANGNTIGQTEGALSTSYHYDFENRLKRVEPPSGLPTTYTYDVNGLRVRKAGPDGTLNYLLDPLDLSGVAQVVEEYDDSGSSIASYVYGQRLISQARGSARTYYLQDGPLNTRTLTDEGGNVTDRYAFDAFGTALATSGATSNVYRYAGEQSDAESGLTYLRARYYSPRTGRFFSVDPYAGTQEDPVSLHRYLYARANPVSYSDPSGLSGDYQLSSLMVTFTINSSISAGIAAWQGKSAGQIFTAGIVSGGLGAAGGLLGQYLAKGAVAGMAGAVAGKGTGYFTSKAASIFMAYPRLMLPGTIAFTKALVTTGAFVVEKAATGEKTTAGGTAGYFLLTFGFEFAGATMGMNAAAAGEGVKQARERLVTLMHAAEAKGQFDLAQKAYAEMRHIDVLSGVGLFQVFRDGGLYKLAPRTVVMITQDTFKATGQNLGGLHWMCEAILEFAEELF